MLRSASISRHPGIRANTWSALRAYRWMVDRGEIMTETGALVASRAAGGAYDALDGPADQRL
jgi:hypothetical protein